MTGRLSIRTRVLIAMLSVITLVIASVAFLVDALFVRQLERNVGRALDDRVALGVEITTRDAPPPSVVLNRLSRDGFRAELALRSGERLGVDLPSSAPSQYRYRLVTLVDGRGPYRAAQLTVWVPADQISSGRRSLDVNLAVIGMAALVGATVLTFATVDVALKPLEIVSGRVHRIRTGERGVRMSPSHPDTEIGQVASRIDDMLEELEGVERRATAAERDAVEAQGHMRRFLADAAHELKTPIAGIQAGAEALVQLPEDADVSERDELAFLLGREANRSARLVSSLLEAARLDLGVELAKDAIDLTALVVAEQGRIGLIRPDVRLLVETEPVTVVGDQQAVTSVVRNLLDNAVRAAGAEGWVAMSVAEIEAPTENRHGSARMASVQVADSGPGIEASDRERIFQRLVRLAATASTTPGSGLGLPIARGYAEAMGGSLGYFNRPLRQSVPSPVGATFEIQLPVWQEPSLQV